MLHLEEAGLPVRTTQDLDLVLCVEALNIEFVEKFWEFVKQGGYSIVRKSTNYCWYIVADFNICNFFKSSSPIHYVVTVAAKRSTTAIIA